MTLTVQRAGSLTLPTPVEVRGDRDQLIGLSCFGLSAAAPEYSARGTLVRWQRVLLAGATAVVLAGLVLRPRVAGIVLVAVATLAYVTALTYRLILFRLGARGGRMVAVTDEEARAVPDAALPVYTVLVPVFHEPLLADLVERLETLDYPRHLLDIQLLLEADDDETAEAAKTLQPRDHLGIVYVPSREPRTKPKACNYGFLTSEGQMCTIYDAEDAPDPLQLRRAVVAMRRL